MTCDRQIGADAGAFFNIVTSQQYTYPLKELIVSPYAMRRELILRVRREADAARRGLPSAIAVKVNSLSDPEMIHEVYEAAAAGVPVTMLVRGICCARIPANDNLRIYSIVGRFWNIRASLTSITAATGNLHRLRGLDAAQFKPPH